MQHSNFHSKGFRLLQYSLLVAWLHMAGCNGQVSTPNAETAQPPESEGATVQRSTLTPMATSVPSLRLTETTTQPLVSRIQGQLAVLVAESPGYSLKADLYVVDIDTGEISRLTQNAAVNSLSWSPDGRRIAFSSLPPDQSNYDIFIADIDGSGMSRFDLLLTGGAHKDEVSWSPSGDRLAFVQRAADEGRIHTVNVDGTNIQFLTEGNSPNWSPDGKSLVFIRRNRPKGTYGDIFVIGADGKSLYQLTKDILANWPSWSPNGQRIAFLGYLPNGNSPGLYVVNADGSGLKFLDGNIDSPPSWSLDGRILFTENGQVNAIDAEGLQITPVAGLPSNLYYIYVLPQPK